MMLESHETHVRLPLCFDRGRGANFLFNFFHRGTSVLGLQQAGDRVFAGGGQIRRRLRNLLAPRTKEH